jgi:molybdenum cofactor synthesis domain-containing protein
VPGARIILDAVEAAILTIGNELVSGDVSDTNGPWLAKRLAERGIEVVLTAAIPDELERIVDFVRREARPVDWLLVTGGLGGTPDDVTREALAAAFDVAQVEVPELAAELRERFSRDPDYAARWAQLPAGSRPLVNPLGGAPGFAIGNVYVLPGLPAEMEAMFDAVADELGRAAPIAAWRAAFATGESRIADVLQEAVDRWPTVVVGSYPSFGEGGSRVEIVLKSRDADALAAAAAWLEPELRLRSG